MSKHFLLRIHKNAELKNVLDKHNLIHIKRFILLQYISLGGHEDGDSILLEKNEKVPTEFRVGVGLDKSNLIYSH